MKTIETKMPFCRSVSRWATLWVLTFWIFLAAQAWLVPTLLAQSTYEPYTFTTLAGPPDREQIVGQARRSQGFRLRHSEQRKRSTMSLGSGSSQLPRIEPASPRPKATDTPLARTGRS